MSSGGTSTSQPEPIGTTVPSRGHAHVTARIPEARVEPVGPSPQETWSSSRDARALVLDDTHVWIATGGGLDRYTRSGDHARKHYGTSDGLDTLDVRSVEQTPDTHRIVAHTGTGRCVLDDGDRFACVPESAPAAMPVNLELFHAHALAARIVAPEGTWTATRGGGAFLGDSALDASSSAPASFVLSGTTFRGAMWLGTFDDGLYRVALDAQGRVPGSLASATRPVPTPVRMVNRVVATAGASPMLLVGGNEGLFTSRDGVTFTRTPHIAARAITGLAVTKKHVWVASSDYRLAGSAEGPVQRAFVYPAGTHAIQGIAVGDDGVAWLATEDRGVVRIDTNAPDKNEHARALDRLAGLPTSWFVAVESDGVGGVYASTLRHGSVHIARDTKWETLAFAPNAWGLSVQRNAERVCLGTQGGAACANARQEITQLAALPDPRVHAFLPLPGKDGGVIVGTEAGVALYLL